MNNLEILKVIYEESKSTSPVTVQFGYVDKDNICRNDRIILKEAAPRIIEKLIELGCICSLYKDGLYVYGL
jgi:hypothetical protein